MRVRHVHHFRLTRWQRACTLAAEWWLLLGIVGLLFALFGWALSFHLGNTWVWWLAGLLLVIVFRGLGVGIIGLWGDGVTCVEIAERGVGFGRESARWWVHSDGIKGIRRNPWGTTSIRHHNGTVIDMPTKLVSPEELEWLRRGMDEYREWHARP